MSCDEILERVDPEFADLAIKVSNSTEECGTGNV